VIACHPSIMKAAACMIAVVGAAAPKKGPRATARVTNYKIEGTDSGKMHVYYPSDAQEGEQFPLISYAHGLAGGSIDLLGYTAMFNQLASWGFVVVAPNTCNLGCSDPVKSPWADCNQVAVTGKNPDADGWNTWFGEQLKAIEWAKQQDDKVLNLVDWNYGVSIAGHSMGGQATAWAAHSNCTTQYNIKAAAVHHGVWGTTNDQIGVPLAAFGSTGDASISMKTKQMFDQSPVYPKIWRYLKGSSHLEPVTEPPAENPLLATFTAAWFKYNIGQDPDGTFHDMIFDTTDPDSMCNSQEMDTCTLLEKEVIV